MSGVKLVISDDAEGHWIDIDLSEQILRIYDGTKLEHLFWLPREFNNIPP
jgi:hypothetical protein